MTAYVVLKLDEVGHWFEWSGEEEGRGAEGAVRASNPGPGTYVAVPARSWKPQVVEVEQVARVTVKAVDA